MVTKTIKVCDNDIHPAKCSEQATSRCFVCGCDLCEECRQHFKESILDNEDNLINVLIIECIQEIYEIKSRFVCPKCLDKLENKLFYNEKAKKALLDKESLSKLKANLKTNVRKFLMLSKMDEGRGQED
jgi:hypothetical protein